ncbi:MAG TPA: hypothetical protein PLB02_14165, partial [Thermoanaerobaculia bacterium]|nr:hypothetical protein [Thermoanaerobaculia bacterium]
MRPSPARRLALVLLAALPAAARPEGEAPPPPPIAPRVEFAAIGTGFIPLSGGEAKAGLWYASVVGSWTPPGFGARADVRGTPDGFRPYYGTDIWLQEGYAWAATPAGNLAARSRHLGV